MKCKKCGREFRSLNEELIFLCGSCIVDGSSSKVKRRKSVKGVGSAHSAREAFADREELVELFPDLEISERLGSGGMGIVFKARQKSLDRWVAIKVLDPALEGDPEFEERFENEAKAMAMLNHPHILSIYDFGVRGRYHYLLMEYVDGKDLQKLIKEGVMELELIYSIILQISKALHFAHQMNVVHRDVKPGNILIDRDGVAKVGDFGLARILRRNDDPALTVGEVGMGTPDYIAPEQLTDAASIDCRADIFSFGVVVYEMLTGHPPRGNFSPPTSKLSKPNQCLDRAILAAMEPDLEDRISDVREISKCVTDPEPLTSERRSSSSLLIFRRGLIALGILLVLCLLYLSKSIWEPVASQDPGTLIDPATLIPPVGEGLTEEYAAQRAQGGSLRKWEEKPGWVNVSAATGLNDLISVNHARIHGSGWYAARMNGEMVSIVPAWNDRRDYRKVLSSFWIAHPDYLIPVSESSRRYLSFLKPTERAIDVAEADDVAVAITPAGKVVIAARESWRKSRKYISRRLEEISDAVAIDSYGKTFCLLTSQGETVSWNDEQGFFEGPFPRKRAVQLQAGGKHVLGLFEDGTVRTWCHPGMKDPNYERLVLALEEPPESGPFIRVEAFDFVNAAQRPDGTWVAWGSDQDRGLIDKVNSLGVVLDFEFFPITAKQGAKMVWIEPGDSAPDE